MLLTVSLVSDIVDAVWVRRAAVVLLKLLNDELDHALLNEYGHKVGLDRNLLEATDAESQIDTRGHGRPRGRLLLPLRQRHENFDQVHNDRFSV